MLDVEMDCSVAEGGWFEVKALVVSGESQELERDIFKEKCTNATTSPALTIAPAGSCAFPPRSSRSTLFNGYMLLLFPPRPPFQSKNHVALPPSLPPNNAPSLAFFSCFALAKPLLAKPPLRRHQKAYYARHGGE